jgi:hypothetical protein
MCASKAQHILSSNKVIMDEGALPEGVSLDDFAEEVSRPDAIIVKRPGKELVINAERDLAAPHLDLMSRGINMIQQVGGVTDENLGRQTNAASGIAIQRRQDQGTLATNKPFDNLRLAAQMQGELQLSLLEQFCTEEKSFRITNERGSAAFHSINDGLPENEITRTKADFVIGEADWRNTMREAAATELLNVISKMPPQIGLLVLDLAVEFMDIPNRDEIAKRIRGATGMKDPDQTEPTPEEIAQAEAAQKSAQFQEAIAMAELENKQADTAVKLSTAAKNGIAGQLDQARTLNERVTATNTAMTAATAVITMPTIARVADGVLQEAGWQDFTKPQSIGLPPMPGAARPPIATPPDIQDVQPKPAPEPAMQEQPMPEQAGPAPEPMAMPAPMARPPIGMPPIEQVSARPPIGVGPTSEVQASIEAVKQISDGTMAALTEVVQAVATMAQSMEAMNKPKTSKVVIEKQADGSFVGKKVEE